VLEVVEVLPDDLPARTAFQEASGAARPPVVFIPDDAEPPAYSFVAQPTSAPSSDPPTRVRKKRRPVAEDEEPDFEGVRRLQQQLRTINFGLNLHYWKYLCVTMSMLFFMSGGIVQTFSPLFGLLLILLSFVASVAAPILGILGSIYCNGPIIPAGARSLISTSLALDIASLALAALAALAVVFVPAAGLAILGLSGLSNLAGFSLFMLFLRKLASYLGDNILAQRAFHAMIRFLAVTVGGLVAIVVLNVIVFFVLRFAFSITAVVLDIVWIVLVINALFQILNVIADVRQRVMER
jgi:hypothetical protein